MPDLSRFRPARLTRFGARLRDCEGGLAFIEFAMSLPVLVTLALCGLETANYAMAHLRVANIAMLTADNASRVRDSIDESNVVEIFTGAKMSGDSIDFRQNGRIILSSVERNGNNNGNGLWIRWQRCDGQKNVASNYGGEGHGNGNNNLPEIGPDRNKMTPAPGAAVMVVEVSYDYQPIVSEAIIGRRTIRYESAFITRQRVNQAITNTTNLTTAQRRTCNQFQA